jgi:DtxR family transcriptional regulator, Mn-dependent transcriptional regulator
MASESVENYIKCIYSLEQMESGGVSTNAIAEKLSTKASSVTDMLKKLKEKGLTDYKKYHGARLTTKGRKMAVGIIRRHRLWEVFLVEKLAYGWEEVHDIAEQLEHIESEELSDRLDQFLSFPRFDPHGDPIPDSDGKIRDEREKIPLASLQVGETGVVIGVQDSSADFLKYLDDVQLQLGAKLELSAVYAFDQSMVLKVNNKERTVSHLVSKNILVQKT